MTRVGRGKAGRARGAASARAGRADVSGKAAGARTKGTAGKRGAATTPGPKSADDPVTEAYRYLSNLSEDSFVSLDLGLLKKNLEIVTEALSATLDSYDAKIVVLDQAQKELLSGIERADKAKSDPSEAQNEEGMEDVEMVDQEDQSSAGIKRETDDDQVNEDSEAQATIENAESPSQIQNESREDAVSDSESKSKEDATSRAASRELKEESTAAASQDDTLHNEHEGLEDEEHQHDEQHDKQSYDLKEAVQALGLFKEEPGSSDEEYLKKLYGVASYPKVDIQDLLPGKIPDEDFTRAKPPNQVQFTTFASAIEPFFRPYVEEDLSFLKQRAVGLEGQQYIQPYALSISPFIIPSLGPYYADVWTAEDAAIGNKMSYTPKPVDMQRRLSNFQPKGSEEAISDAVLETEKVAVGPLVSRLLSALISEAPEAMDIKTNDQTEGVNEENETEKENETESDHKGPAFIDSEQSWKVGIVKADYASLENRLKREFRYVGILDVNLLKEEERKKKLVEAITTSAADGANGNGPVAASLIGEDDDDDDRDNDDEEYDIDWVNGREDDEICVELRALQKNLRQGAKLNQACKRRLIPLVQEQMAYQEYVQILEDLDKQVDQAYLRRIRNTPKNKKKKTGAVASTAPANTLSSSTNDASKSGLRLLLDKRQRWVEKIGPVFRPAHLMKRMPQESIFKAIEEEEDEEEEYV